MFAKKTALCSSWGAIGLVATACSFGPAEAGSSTSALGGDDCPNGAICVYTGTDYSDSRFAFDQAGECLVLQEGFAHKIASAFNKTNKLVRFYDSADCGATSGKQIAELSSAAPDAPEVLGSAIGSLSIDAQPDNDGAPPTANCNYGVCLWENPDFGGRGLMFSSAGECFNLDRFALDYKTSSFINHSTSVVHFYAQRDCGGENEATFEDGASSNKVLYEDVIASVYIGPRGDSQPASDTSPSDTSPPDTSTPDTSTPPANLCDVAVSHCQKSNGKFYCSNQSNSALYAEPKIGAKVDTLETSWSWFACWTKGEAHGGGNTTWYYTMGDDTNRWGYVPASSLGTVPEFDANPSQCGLPNCSNL